MQRPIKIPCFKSSSLVADEDRVRVPCRSDIPEPTQVFLKDPLRSNL